MHCAKLEIRVATVLVGRVIQRDSNMRPVLPLHRVQLAANEVCGLELGRVQGSGREAQASLCFA